MSVQAIPAKTLLTCDRCKRSGEQFKPGPFLNGGLSIRRAESWGRSWDGGAHGTTIDLDLCEDCAHVFLSMKWEETP